MTEISHWSAIESDFPYSADQFAELHLFVEELQDMDPAQRRMQLESRKDAVAELRDVSELDAYVFLSLHICITLISAFESVARLAMSLLEMREGTS